MGKSHLIRWNWSLGFALCFVATKTLSCPLKAIGNPPHKAF